ncbi:hypothetical protein PHMEG_0005233 [Phytophthora megakarya]|uniref:Helitron helicase n=1 Tax=Phytophthora megakarya TaxID=4795 RepID=A0A225WS00_9STRA|nr:hypothetical protein PHMEG_0005233 [Phytophthora megakarya]
MRSSRRFARDETFVLVAFDRLSTQRMFMQISLTCQRHPTLFREHNAITQDELSVALRDNELCHSPAERFLLTVETGTGVFGEVIWNRNGADEKHLLVRRCLGNRIIRNHYATCGEFHFRLPGIYSPLKSGAPPSCYEGRFCVYSTGYEIHRCIYEDGLAVNKKTGLQKPFGGLFGTLKTFYGMVETQGGGTLHDHFIIWLNCCLRNSADLERLTSTDAARASLPQSIEAFFLRL